MQGRYEAKAVDSMVEKGGRVSASKNGNLEKRLNQDLVGGGYLVASRSSNLRRVLSCSFKSHNAAAVPEGNWFCFIPGCRSRLGM